MRDVVPLMAISAAPTTARTLAAMESPSIFLLNVAWKATNTGALDPVNQLRRYSFFIVAAKLPRFIIRTESAREAGGVVETWIRNEVK
jgi:hypothetical protein